jgi:hypothetical protein
VKNSCTYRFFVVGLLAAVLLFFAGCKNTNQFFNKNLSLKKDDKNPYGAYVAYDNWQRMFPDAVISTNKKEPQSWDSLSVYDEHQVWILVSRMFNPDSEELNRLINFAKNGNDVFISTLDMNDEAKNFFGVELNDALSAEYSTQQITDAYEENDSVHIGLSFQPFKDSSSYFYPGINYARNFTAIDSTISYVLANNEDKQPYYIKIKSGKGNVYLHLAPFTFTNYFLLRSNNINYFEKAVSVLPTNAKTVVLDNYFTSKRYTQPNQNSKEEPNPFSEMMKEPALKWSFFAALILIALYVITEIKRKQRIVPVHVVPKNESLDFVKTIGRLYFDKKDNKNLAQKMGAYFLEHVRNKYKLNTSVLDEAFVQKLAAKSGIAEMEIKSVVDFISFSQTAMAVSDPQLSKFHVLLEKMYSVMNN